MKLRFKQMPVAAVAVLILACASALVSSEAIAQTATDPCEAPRNFTGSHIRSPASLYNTPLSKITPAEAFRATSGYYCDWPNLLPTMYAHSGNKITVVGPGYERIFDLKDFDEAAKVWHALLMLHGYGGKN